MSMATSTIKKNPVSEIGVFQFNLDSSITIPAGGQVTVFDKYDIRSKIGRAGKTVVGITYLWSNAGACVPMDTMIWGDCTVNLTLRNITTSSVTITSIRLQVCLS